MYVESRPSKILFHEKKMYLDTQKITCGHDCLIPVRCFDNESITENYDSEKICLLTHDS